MGLGGTTRGRRGGTGENGGRGDGGKRHNPRLAGEVWEGYGKGAGGLGANLGGRGLGMALGAWGGNKLKRRGAAEPY